MSTIADLTRQAETIWRQVASQLTGFYTTKDFVSHNQHPEFFLEAKWQPVQLVKQQGILGIP